MRICDNPAMDVRLVFCTCPDSGSAQTLAHHLVERRLAACVNLLPPMQSVYRWQGQIEQAEEVQLLIKTCADRLDALMLAITQQHPYELPEIVAISPSAGLPAYMDWIRAQTREEH
ncbi:divalent-cation tolerance protein CutA [Stenotrophomonas sp. SY1]|uniref:divalent-cation tolerance protein CutA n=1 Tax=Stenotrophomonas sp. SY1 TaxID=477235 RepID=UPI001E2CBADD|nr:divalent-cation tolerance protein CutA [Stenotrophomonas sp. SY1]MCD9088311.1 divalent-cation tolerance protein CutA [Stenotrophomonas sp. SY1]